jgi:hypothetical protein
MFINFKGLNLGGLYMYTNIKSNRFFITAVLTIALSGCMQDLAERNYSPTEPGYENVVAQNMNKMAAKKMAAASGYTAPVQYNNPYAYDPSIGGPAAYSGVPVINNNAYGSLGASGGGVIQTGVFIPNTQPSQYNAPAYGSGGFFVPPSQNTR